MVQEEQVVELPEELAVIMNTLERVGYGIGALIIDFHTQLDTLPEDLRDNLTYAWGRAMMSAVGESEEL